MNQGPEQLLQISNRHHVGPIRWRVVGVFMRLDEHRRTTDCNGGAGKHRHEAAFATTAGALAAGLLDRMRSEEHTSELQSLMRISYAVFCLKKKNNTTTLRNTHDHEHKNMER